MEMPQGKFVWIVKIGEKGQFVIPKEARDLFDLQPGSSTLVFGDVERGIAILPRAEQNRQFSHIFEALSQEEVL